MTQAEKAARQVLMVGASFAAALAFAPGGHAAVQAAPVILKVAVYGPKPLPAGGAPVVVWVSVANARSCTFLRQYSAFSALYAFKTVSCVGGRAAIAVPAIPNTYKAPVQLSFEVRAVGPGGIARQVVKVAQAAASPPAVVSTAPSTPPSPSYRLTPNWSGYALPSSSIFTAADGTFTVPTLDCSVTPDGGVSEWVGIGGYGWPQGGSSGSLLQTGVESNCVSGAQQNLAWWELVPTEPNHSFAFRDLPVSAGDTITASVYQSSNDGTWWTRLDDTTAGLSGWMQIGGRWGVGSDDSNDFHYQGSTALLSYSGGYTAEWIVEDYTEPDGQTLASLADFGTVSFTNLRASATNWYINPEDGLALADVNGNVLATPSPPGGDGSFTVTYTG